MGRLLSNACSAVECRAGRAGRAGQGRAGQAGQLQRGTVRVCASGKGLAVAAAAAAAAGESKRRQKWRDESAVLFVT